MPGTLTIEYPELLPHQLRQSREEFERDARLALAAKLFEMKRVSSGVAATIAGAPMKDLARCVEHACRGSRADSLSTRPKQET